MVEFLHTGVHYAFWRDLTRRFTVAGEVSPELLVVTCPTCGADYFAHPLREVPPLTALTRRSAARRSARAHLAGECPDHGHRFALDS